MNELFGIEENKDNFNIEYKNTSKVTLFSYLQDICFYKRGDLHETDFELKQFNKFMVLKFLSMENSYLPIVNVLNQYQDILNSLELYKILLLVIPKSKKFLKYPKLENKIYKDSEIELLQKYFETSKKDVLQYLELGLISNSEKEEIINKFGG